MFNYLKVPIRVDFATQLLRVERPLVGLKNIGETMEYVEAKGDFGSMNLGLLRQRTSSFFTKDTR